MANISNAVALSFDDVQLRPQYSTLTSRLDCNVYSDYLINGKMYKLAPIMPANMPNITTFEMAKSLMDLGIVVPFHRFSPYLEFQNVLSFAGINPNVPVSASVGLCHDNVETILSTGLVDLAFLELAHADSKRCHDMIGWIRKKYPSITLVVGNVCTKQSTKRLIDAGAHIVKVGIAPGSVCETKNVTGTGMPQLCAIMECTDNGVPIIADGGIKSSGDIVKALAAGASFVMCGYLFAGTIETNAQDASSGLYNYGGSASSEIRNEFGMQKEGITSEGRFIQVKPKGSARDVALNLLAGVRQGMSMLGAANLAELINNAYFQRVR
jgi:IMP dehydrogenase